MNLLSYFLVKTFYFYLLFEDISTDIVLFPLAYLDGSSRLE